MYWKVWAWGRGLIALLRYLAMLLNVACWQIVACSRSWAEYNALVMLRKCGVV